MVAGHRAAESTGKADATSGRVALVSLLELHDRLTEEQGPGTNDPREHLWWAHHHRLAPWLDVAAQLSEGLVVRYLRGSTQIDAQGRWYFRFDDGDWIDGGEARVRERLVALGMQASRIDAAVEALGRGENPFTDRDVRRWANVWRKEQQKG
jgi:hypothetical protein